MRAAAQSRIASWSVMRTVSAIRNLLLRSARTPERKAGVPLLQNGQPTLTVFLRLGAGVLPEPQGGGGCLDNELFIALLNPAIALTLAAAFFLLWLYRRHRLHLLMVAVAYAGSAVGFLLQYFVLPIGPAG